jgi:hypothetical protein
MKKRRKSSVQKRARSKRYVASLRRQDRCTYCQQKSDGHWRCPRCQKEQSRLQKIRRQRWQAAGRCIICGSADRVRQGRCSSHQDRAEEYRRRREKIKEWLALGLCRRCGEPRDPASKSFCLYHLVRNRDAARKANNRRALRQLA